MTDTSEAAPGAERGLAEPTEERVPALFHSARGRLSPVERMNINIVRWTFTTRWVDAVMRTLQWTVGATWVDWITRRIRKVHGLDRIPDPKSLRRFILVANHRTYFDLFLPSMVLFKAGMHRRVMYPIRTNFFYDSVLGLLLNGSMSWFSMYPPIFRDKKKLALNHTAMNEMAALLSTREVGAGIHPEGTRNKDPDPYRFLPVQNGVGRLIHQAPDALVIPVFVSGLVNSFAQQLALNFAKDPTTIMVLFGAPLDLRALCSAPPNARTYRQIAQATMHAIQALAEEEKALRQKT